MTKLTPEQRVRVADECTGLSYRIHQDEEYGAMIVLSSIPLDAETDDIEISDQWIPEDDDYQNLITGIAQLINKCDPRNFVDLASCFFEAVDANDIDSLESLCFELLEDK